MLLHEPSDAGALAPRLIAEGDLVVVYERFDSMKGVKIDPKKSFDNKFGFFALKEWVGRPYGSRVSATRGNGWVYVLAPTPELWTTVLRHRTQILYIADISLVCTLLDLRPGCTVLESGTGSGSLTTSLARAVATAGRVLTFEFHEERASQAAEEFKANGLEGVVVTHRDIEANGFPQELHGQADAVFLDLPGPWKVVPSAASCLRYDGTFCSFSPCIEQVQRTCRALNDNGFCGLRTVEVLLRAYDVTTGSLITDLDAGAAKQQGRGGRQQQQQGRDKRRKVEEGGSSAMADDGKGEAEGGGGEEGAAERGGAKEQQQRPPSSSAAAPPAQALLVRPVSAGRGHTGYLTFARKAVPASYEAGDAPGA